MKYFLTACCLALLSCSAALAQSGKLGIAAIVNDSVITSSEVDARYALAVHGANLQPDADTQKQIRHQALDSLIDEQIRIQESTRLGVQPDEKDVDEAFAKLAEQNNMTPEKFKSVLDETPGQYDSLRHQMRTQIAWSNVVRKKIRPQINITETDINSYLADKAKNPAKVEYEVAEIFMKNNDNNLKLAQQLVSEIRSGKQRFSVVAHQFSEGLEASKGGMLGWIPEHRLEPELDDAIQKTAPGQLTDPIISPRGIHIFLVREKRDVLPASEASARLHLKQMVVPLPPNAPVPPDIDAKAREQAKFFQSQAPNCVAADVAIKKINSPFSRDLGEMRLSDLPPTAVNVVKDLPIDKAADPVRTKDGYVVYIVCDRAAGGDEKVRDDVADEIGTDRLNRLQYRYYRDLRAAAYVDIRQN